LSRSRSASERLATVRTQRTAAEQRAQRAGASLERKREQFKHDEVEPTDYYALRDELTAEREAAEAEADRVAEERGLAEGGPVRDAEERFARHLEELRRAVAGEVSGESLAQVRAKLGDLFAAFYIARADTPVSPP
jgi:hypothetical protein